jgi:uncharacterized membrane protein YraQ (UPF0718 family)
MQNLSFAIVINTVVFLVWFFLFQKDRNKGLEALKSGLQAIFSMLPFILIIICVLGVLSSFISPKLISQYLGDHAGKGGFLLISVFSSFLQIPGIIAFPIAASLRQNGAAISVVAVFACASTMASVVTFPIEIKYLGKKLPFIRIFITYIISVSVGFLTGLIFHLFT